MGGVDILSSNDSAFKKCYKSLFLGLIDFDIIYAFILYNCRRAADGKPKMTHVQF
ncbi:hypothetical protein F442_15915 [Phytophthora nicotianae P10297]|uniref:PiggyBac transposable element-derived protein domain-containing protein n=3 Tax=Phytophthora nicotianae TaxID=4792 RepID=W2YLY6_PHYNI|nr:hypothetical protein F444_16047 [Phytophthora nicotianae P1976]ETP36045.1 hypothetical protein F442_15915 [Phytophthora nicotianae P10297]